MSVQTYGGEGSHPCAGTLLLSIMPTATLPYFRDIDDRSYSQETGKVTNTNADREILFMKAFDPYFIFTLHSEFAGS